MIGRAEAHGYRRRGYRRRGYRRAATAPAGWNPEGTYGEHEEGGEEGFLVDVVTEAVGGQPAARDRRRESRGARAPPRANKHGSLEGQHEDRGGRGADRGEEQHGGLANQAGRAASGCGCRRRAEPEEAPRRRRRRRSADQSEQDRGVEAELRHQLAGGRASEGCRTGEGTRACGRLSGRPPVGGGTVPVGTVPAGTRWGMVQGRGDSPAAPKRSEKV